jgi:hypothetical protein
MLCRFLKRTTHAHAHDQTRDTCFIACTSPHGHFVLCESVHMSFACVYVAPPPADHHGRGDFHPALCQI